jgi:hypothetical protein
MAESMAANSTDGSFRPNAAYAALIVSNADMVWPPDDALRSATYGLYSRKAALRGELPRRDLRL